ncbi:MAG: DUF2970 domain-containing protein [Gammaproteobacteria bacterium]|nr:DUF2970 domain-containing protein [Gammaproteobacteria bacterium]
MAVAFSVLAAAFGVQSSRNRKRDFQQGKLVHFVIGGLIGTAVFIFVVILMVRLVMSGA